MDRSLWLDAVAAENPPELLWEDSERKFSRVWRADAAGVKQPFIAVCAALEPAAPSTNKRFVHEHALKDHLDEAWALRPRELVRSGGNTFLLLDYHEGQPLDRLLGAPMACARFLRLAVALTGALARLHERGLVHKDIKPANIVVDAATDQVWFTGFGVATRLPRERQAPEPVELIAGTLSHMAPEQTGRMNRSIDARSDLYSLGVTLYQALTGGLPFTASDPLEWVHCHIARLPSSPRERVADIPPNISAIVMKLLAKTPEERYQTAAGAETDLRRCLSEWEGRGVVHEFTLGEHDHPDVLRIPERLYGREPEIAELLGAFHDVVVSGKREFVLVRGAPGIGKSSVVHELHKALVLPHGLFASGKFDERERNVPYSTLVQAFQGLIRRLLSKPENELRKWRDDLRRALEPNGALLAELIPELRFIIGEQSAVPDVPAAAARARLQIGLRSLIAVFARPEHPLCLFFDDLQWLDEATLDLLQHLLVESELHHLLLVGAYRDSEVEPTHPLAVKIAAIRAAGVEARTIVLGPLRVASVAELLAGALHCDHQQAMPLAQLVHDKTGGNPFFVNQFIHALADDALLSFVPARARWVWDLRAIQARGFTENVVELMLDKLRRLPSTTQHALREFACLGTRAEVQTLACSQAASSDEVHSSLWQALVLELIVRVESSYRFAHDRVHEAAYALISEPDRAAAHLTIGRRLAVQFQEDEREEVIFELVGQLNRGSALIGSEHEREQLAELNLIAAKRAKAAAAYATALSYLTTATSLLSEAWHHRRDLHFEISFHRAECEFLTGEFAASEARLVALTSRAESSLERAAVACLLADVYIALQRIDRCLVVCFGYLESVGLSLPMQPTAEQTRAAYEHIFAQLGGRPIEALAELPLSIDAAARATLDVLAKLARCVQTEVDMSLQCVILCAAVTLSLERGHSDSSCYAYAFFGLSAGWRFGDFEAGLRFGRLGLALVEHKGLRRYEAIVCSALGIITPWAAPVRECFDLFRRAIDVGDKAGDPVSAVSCCCCLVSNLLMAGEPLAEVEEEAESALSYCRRVAFRDFIDAADTQAAFIRNLRGLTRQFGSFDDDRFDERRLQNHFDNEPHVRVFECWYWIRVLQARVFAGEYGAALDASSRARALLASSTALVEVAEYELYSALAHAAQCDSADATSRPLHLAALAAHHGQLEEWAKHAPENFENRALLLAAELARLEARELDAMRLFERAIRSAQHSGFVQNEALATERAAHFHEARGFDKIAKAYLRDARQCYLRWGADGKVRQLDERYPDLRAVPREVDPARTVQTPLEHWDLATVLKVLQAVARETDLDALIATLMRLALEHAGAERGLLIFPGADSHRLEAEAVVLDTGATVVLRRAPLAAEDLPESVLNYVRRTSETVVLDDLSAEAERFKDDGYGRRPRTRSVLCLPLLKQSRLVAIIYLENNLSAGVFTAARTALLELLAAEAAISLENAQLYRELREREAKVRRLVDSNVIGVVIRHADGRIVDTNDAFLRIVGYEREELLSGRVRFFDLTPPEWHEHQPLPLPAHVERRATSPQEREYIRKDGSRVPVLIGGAMFDGTSDEGVAFVVDLSERKQAEEALRAREHESRQIVDTMPAMAWSAHPDGTAEFFNRHYLDYVGLNAEEARGWRWTDSVHPDDIEHLVTTWRESMASGIPGEAEARVRRRDGEYRWFLQRANPLRDELGNIVRWYGVNTDIEDRKRAENELRRAYNSFAEAQRLSQTGSFITDLGSEHTWSEETHRILGIERGTQITMQTIRELIHPDDLPAFDSTVSRALTGANIDFAFRLVTRGGIEKHVRGGAHVLEWIYERPVIVGALQDVTASKLAEEALNRARTELAHVAQVGSLSILAASIAHEVNQPLSGIITNVGTCLRMLDADPPNLEGARQTVRRTIRDGNRAAEVVSRLRALYSKGELTREPLDLNEATREVMALSSSELRRNGIVLQATLADDLPRVAGDRIQLQQVILNLVRNGADAMLNVHGRPRQLLIRTEQAAGDGVRVTVRDVGTGFDPTQAKNLFDAFYTTKQNGMGVGLSICRSIIERHQGRIWAEANDGPGATFSFSIPGLV